MPPIAVLAGAFVVAGITASTASAQDTYIACTIVSTYDFTTGRTKQTTGDDVFVISPQPNGPTTYTLPFSCAEGTFQSGESATEIWFSCDQRTGNLVFERYVKIDRVTGEYTSVFAPKGKNGLVHNGSCVRRAPQF